MKLNSVYNYGHFDALLQYKIATKIPPIKVVKDSKLLGGKPSTPKPLDLSQKTDLTKNTIGDIQRGTVSHQQKLAQNLLCTSCKKLKHYGNCKRENLSTKGSGIPAKAANFNMGMLGSEASEYDNQKATSPNYNSATVADSSMARARDTIPPEDQAASSFREHRRMYDKWVADQPDRTYGGLVKTFAYKDETFDQEGPTVNPYKERPQRLSTPVGSNIHGVGNAFKRFDAGNNTNQTSAEQSSGEPSLNY